MTQRFLLAAVLTAGVGVSAAPALAASALVFSYGSSVGTTNISSALTADGHTVTNLGAISAGGLATALGSGSYDQLYMLDITTSALINADDLSALSSFYASNPSLVVDSRSYGYHFQGTDASEVALIQNVAAAFDLYGGGMWIGTDHAPEWALNGNAALSEIGVSPITGSYSNAVNASDPESILLSGVTTTDLWGAGASVGSVPLGVQANGTDMRFHFGHSSEGAGAIPYISASFGTFVAPDEERPVSDVPLPAGGALLLGALGLLGLRRRMG